MRETVRDMDIIEGTWIVIQDWGASKVTNDFDAYDDAVAYADAIRGQVPRSVTIDVCVLASVHRPTHGPDPEVLYRRNRPVVR